MAYFEGLLSGFAARKGEREQETLKEAQRAADQEARVYETLLASPDPEIQSLAAAGLLSSAQPRKRAGGLRGWLGELEQSPYLSQIQELIRTPVTEERVTPGLPSRTLRQQIPMQAPSVAPAALPDQSTVEPGAPPPTTPVATPPPVVFEERAGPAVGRVDRVTRPRRVFPTAGDVAAEQYGGRARGLMQALREAQTDEERALVLELSGANTYGAGARGTGTTQLVQGVLPDGSIAWAINDRRTGSPTFGRFLDPDTQQPIADFTPRVTTGSASMGTDRTAVAVELFGKRPEQLLPEQMARVNAELQRRVGTTAATRETSRAGAAAAAPLSSAQRFQALTDLQESWRKAEAPRTEMLRQFEIMQTSLGRFRQGDLIGGSQGILVTFQRILDPQSVVRESEYARTPQGLGLLQRIEGFAQRLTQGGAGVPEPELAAMVETARQFVAGMADYNAVERQRLTGTAQEFGLDANLIFGGAAGAPPAPAAPAGTATPPPAPGGPAAGPRFFRDAQGNWIIRQP